ncbi:MAG: hypothetical protein IKT09_03370 [Synergistes sp.]|nr:hypothetical protein [Synergistes sp.]
MKKLMSFVMVFAAVLLFISPAAEAALTLKAESLAFNGAQEDVAGSGLSASPDGKPDAVFTLYVTGAQAIRDISVKNETTGVTWSASNQSNFLAVKSSQGEFINASGTMPITPVLLAGRFTLIINNAANAVPKDSTFTATATLIDGKTTSASTEVKASSVPRAESGRPERTPGERRPEQSANEGSGRELIALFESRGESGMDLAGNGEAVGADGRKDFLFDAVIRVPSDLRINGVKITARNGSDSAEWDTVRGNGTPLVVLVDGAKNIVNKSDGSVSFAGEMKCVMLVNDKTGILSKPGTKAKLTVTLSNGRMAEKEATAGKAIVGQNSVKAEFRGTGRYDFVGQNEKLQSNMNPDSFIKVSVNAKGKLTGVRVTNTKNGASWDTVPGNSNPLAVLITSDGKKLNNADGSIAVDVNGTQEFNIAFDEAKDAGTGPYKVTVLMSDGRLLEAATAAGKAAAAEPAQTAAPAAERALVFVSKMPESVPVDLVGKNKKCSPDGIRDMSIIVKATTKDVIRAIVLTDSTGQGWDTIPSNNGRWLIGVRDNGKLLNNTSDGSVKIETAPDKQYELLVQNNGKLALGYGKLTMSVTWGNGSVTESTLQW